MECDEVRRLLDSYLDNELELTRHLELEDHLEGCADCGTAAASALQFNSMVRTMMPVHKPPRALEGKIRASLRKQSWSGRRLYWPNLKSWAYAAAGLLLGLAATWPLSRTPARTDLVYEAIANHTRSLLVSHLVDVPSSDQHTVKPWFTGRLDFSPPVFDYAETGFPLIGARVDILEKRPVAAIVYKHGNHFINLFIWPSSEQLVDQALQSDRGYQYCGWHKGGLNYFCISEISRTDLTSFAETVRAHGM